MSNKNHNKNSFLRLHTLLNKLVSSISREFSLNLLGFFTFINQRPKDRIRLHVFLVLNLKV